jgi:hypothetical protein
LTYIYLVTIPLIAVVNTALIIRMMSLTERIDKLELREERARIDRLRRRLPLSQSISD